MDRENFPRAERRWVYGFVKVLLQPSPRPPPRPTGDEESRHCCAIVTVLSSLEMLAQDSFGDDTGVAALV